jgi:hypothetical protein
MKTEIDTAVENDVKTLLYRSVFVRISDLTQRMQGNVLEHPAIVSQHLDAPVSRVVERSIRSELLVVDSEGSLQKEYCFDSVAGCRWLEIPFIHSPFYDAPTHEQANGQESRADSMTRIFIAGDRINVLRPLPMISGKGRKCDSKYLKQNGQDDQGPKLFLRANTVLGVGTGI